MPEPRAALRSSASAILWRHGPAGALEVFWVRRGDQLRFAGGFYAFPGGRVDETDAQAGDPMIAAATRELFEETGVLVARGRGELSAEARLAGRRMLLDSDGRSPAFASFLRSHDLQLVDDAFAPAGRWITPPMMPVRFDARFFLVQLPAGQAAEVWPGELSDGEWITPAAALARWDKGSALLHPPGWHMLKCLALPEAERDPVSVLPLLQDPSAAPWRLPVEEYVVQRMEFQRGLLMVPLRTPTLPPATHTNCLFLGDEELWVVDPGSPWREEQRALEASLALLAQDGRRAKAILLTHEHVDHVAGAMALSEKLGLPIAASEATRERLGNEVRIDRVLRDGEVLELGEHRWRCLILPGHTRGHTCLIDESSRAVVAGDLVAGVGTVIIDPPEGDMADYLASLKRLLALSPGALYPAHGPVIPHGHGKLEEYFAHRLEREEKVVHSLRLQERPATPAELVPAAYPDVQPALYPYAERSLLAHLLKLEKEARATRVDGARWVLRS